MICSKVIGMVTDNAWSMRSIGKSISDSVCLVGGKHNKLYHINCNAHIINRIVKQLSKNFKFYDQNEYELDDEELEDNCDSVLILKDNEKDLVNKF
jgi:hypothetical protein